MVVISQIWMDTTIDKAIIKAKNENKTVPDNLFSYMDDIYCTITARHFIRTGLRPTNNSNNPAADFTGSELGSEIIFGLFSPCDSLCKMLRLANAHEGSLRLGLKKREEG